MCFPWHSSSFNSSLKIKLTEIELKNWYSCLYKCSSVGKYVSMYEQYLSEFWRPTYFAYLIRLLFTHLRTYLHEGHSWSSQNQRKSQPCNMDVRGYRFFYGSSTWFRFCKSLQGLPSLPVSLTIYIWTGGALSRLQVLRVWQKFRCHLKQKQKNYREVICFCLM